MIHLESQYLVVMTQSLQNLLKDIAKVLIPKSQELKQEASSSRSMGYSPGKVVNLRSNYLQQMRELHTLFECGALTQDEFKDQKESTNTA